MNPNEVNRTLHRLVFFLDRVAESLLERHCGLTFSQFRMLMAIEKKGRVSQAEIAKFHGLTPAAVSRQIDILLEKKLIAKSKHSPTRREHVLQLTPAGQRQTADALAVLHDPFAKIFSSLSRAEQIKFSDIVAKLLNTISAQGTEYFCQPAYKKSRPTRAGR